MAERETDRCGATEKVLADIASVIIPLGKLFFAIKDDAESSFNRDNYYYQLKIVCLLLHDLHKLVNYY